MITEQKAIDLIKSKFELPQVSTETAYTHGYDCGLNGATLTNCHFSIFQSLDHSLMWERGKREGEAAKSKS